MIIGNFAGSFWATFRGFQGSRAFQEKLDREDITFDDILDDDDTIQELKNSNSKLLDLQTLYSFTHEKLEALIDYITVYPPTEADQKQGHKYPFVSAELFACQNRDFLDKFIQNSLLLDRLFSFLVYPTLDITLAGYFSKAVQAMVNCNPTQMFKYISQTNMLPWIATHLEIRSICDIAQKLLLLERQGGPLYLTHRISLFQSLIISLRSPKVAGNVQGVINQLVNRGSDVNSWKELMSELLKVQYLDFILENVTSLQTQVSKNSILVIKNLLTSHNRKEIMQIFGESLGNEDDSATLMDDSQSNYLLNALSRHIQSFVRVFETAEEKQQESTFKERISVLGEHRLIMIDFIVEIVKLQNNPLCSQLASVEISDRIISLFFKHEWNSFLHCSVQQYIYAVLNSDNQDLKSDLLSKSSLVQQLALVGQLKSRPGTFNPHFKPGLSGHITKIANFLVKLAQTQHDVKERLEACEDWKAFVDQILKIQNEIQARSLGGGASSSFLDPNSEEDDYSNFQMDTQFMQQENEEEPEEEVDDKPLTTEELGSAFEKLGVKAGRNRYSEDEEEPEIDLEEEIQVSQEFYQVQYWKISVEEELEDLE